MWSMDIVPIPISGESPSLCNGEYLLFFYSLSFFEERDICHP